MSSPDQHQQVPPRPLLAAGVQRHLSAAPARPAAVCAWRTVLVGVLVVLAVLAGQMPALACSCVEQTLDEAIDNADLIGRGVVLTVRTRPSGEVTYEVFLTEVAKGEKRRTIRLNGTFGQSSCDPTHPKEVGDPVSLWLRGADGQYTSPGCSYPHGHSSADVEAALEARYGPAWKNPEDVPMLLPGLGPAAPLLLGSVAVWSIGPLGLLATAVFLAARRTARPTGP